MDEALRLSSVLSKVSTSTSVPPAASLKQPSVSRGDLDGLERYLDAVWAKLGIDIEFSHHFFDRVNDRREANQPITVAELRHAFTAAFERFGGKFKGLVTSGKKEIEAILNDLSTKLNIPFVLRTTRKGVELFSKTVMRKDNFKSPDKFYRVEGVLTASTLIEQVALGADPKYLLTHSQRG